MIEKIISLYKKDSHPTEWIKEGEDEIKCLITEYKHYKESNVWTVKQGYEEAVEY